MYRPEIVEDKFSVAVLSLVHAVYRLLVGRVMDVRVSRMHTAHGITFYVVREVESLPVQTYQVIKHASSSTERQIHTCHVC